MKKTQKRLFSLLLAFMMIFTPFSQALAETAYDASMGVGEQLLFPKDSLVSAAGMVMLDGIEQPLDEGGTWTNTDEDKVYSAVSAEDGTIHLTHAGYVLRVEGGISEYKNAEKQEAAKNHYEFLDWEKPLETDPTLDIACFESEVKVRLIADEPEEGMEFAGWVTETEGFVIEDPTNPETIIIMPDKKVEIRAEFVPVSSDGAGMGSDMGELLGEIPTDFPVEDLVEEVFQEEYAEEVYQEVPADEGFQEEYVEEVYQEVPADEGFQEEYVEEVYQEVPVEEVLQAESEMAVIGEQTVYAVNVNYGMGSGTYEIDSWVTVTADDRTAEGLAFTGWFVDSMNAALDDASAVTAGFVMPAADVIVTATYAELQTEPQTEAVTEPQTEAVTEAKTEAVTEVQTEAATEAQTEEMQEIPAEPQTEAVTEPVTEAVTEVQTEAATEAQTETITEAPQDDVQFEDESEVTTYNVTVVNGVTGGAYVPGTRVGIEANDRSSEGLVFASWIVTPNTVVLDDVNASITTFTMPAADVTLEAQYVERTYKVTLTDAAFADGTTEKTFKAGETVQVNAVTPTGNKFTGWSVLNASDNADAGISLGDAPAAQISFTMPTKDLVIAQKYEKLPNTYTVTVSNGLINGSATMMTVEEGTVIDVTANPGPIGQAFAYWRINDGAFDMGEATYSEAIRITVTQNLNILAVYEGIEYAVSVKNGSSDYATSAAGSVVTITADPAPAGKVFDHWKVKSENVALANAYSATTTFTMPQGDVSVVAKYRQVTYSVTVENGFSDQDTYHAGDLVTITSNYPASGREFSKWAAVSGNVTFESAGRWETTFTMPAADVTVKATYKDGPSSANNAIQELVAGGQYLAGSTIKFTAYGAGMDNTNPNPGDYRYRPSGYQISNVTGTWQAAPYSTSMTIKAAGEYTLKVIFNKDVYDGEHWVSEGTSDAKSAVFYVVTEAEGVNTGDETPLAMVIALAAGSCVLFLLLLIVFLKRRRR